jgi:hypothetical protein
VDRFLKGWLTINLNLETEIVIGDLTTSQSIPSWTPDRIISTRISDRKYPGQHHPKEQNLPSPVTAEQPKILQLRSFKLGSRSASDISAAPRTPGWSCLLANTNNAVPCSSSSPSIAESSSAAVSRRAWSVASTTKTTAAVLA